MTNDTTSRAHITALVAENVKRLRAVRLEPGPGGGLIEVTGRNGSGKSSVLDAIAYAILGRGAVDPKPIRDGAESAIVSLTLGDVTVTRKFGANGGSTLTVESAEGARFPSPQKMLDALVGASVLTFDPLEFDRMKPADQLDEVRKVAPLPPEVDQWRAERDRAYAQRTDVNREAKTLAAKLAGLPPIVEAPGEVPSVSDLLAALREAHEHNRACDERSAKVIAENAKLVQWREKVVKLTTEAERIMREAAELSAAADELEAAIGAMPTIGMKRDTLAIEAEIERAREAESADAERRRRADLAAELATLESHAAELTATIEDREDLVRRAVASAVMPVPGLTYGENGLEFNGHPLEQASGAERLRVALGLAMAQRPGLRVVRIKDGSLLDEDSLAIVADMARAADFQVWIERVDTTGRVGIVLEDGEVVKVNARGTDAEA
jgi:ABC-type cobalamin/Fe3+-siderophores transport system ATPase subunit